MPDEPKDQSRRIAALDRLQGRSKGVRADPSSLRLYIRDNFAAIRAARGRKASWQQIAEVMANAGARAPDGSDLTWRKVATMFHTERYGKENGRKGKTDRSVARASELPPPSPAPSPPASLGPLVIVSEPDAPATPPVQPPAPVPSGATVTPPGGAANPYAEVERRTAEAKRRREQVEAAKNWNPYPTLQRKDEPDE